MTPIIIFTDFPDNTDENDSPYKRGYQQDYMHTASMRRRNGLISAQVTTSRKARAWCGDKCRDQPIEPYQRCSMHFLVRISETAKSNCAVKRIGESARWDDLTIRLVAKANSMSARKRGLTFQRKNENDNLYKRGYQQEYVRSHSNVKIDIRFQES